MHLWAVGGIVLLFLVCQIAEVQHVRTLRGDETYYIQAAHEMIRSGDWLTPRYESGTLRFQKPILTYWIVGGSIRLFGLSLAAARLPSVLFALATLPFVYGLGCVLLRDRTAALFAVVAHVSSETVYGNAYLARTDTILAFFAAAAVYFFARLIFAPGHDQRNAVLAYAGVAGATLTKGLAGIGFVLLPVVVFLLLSWRRVGRERWRAAVNPWGLVVLILVAAPWFGLMLARHGKTFLDTFFGDQVGIRVTGDKARFLSNLGEYLWLILKGCLPWSVLIVLGLATNDGGIRGKLAERRTEWMFMAVWFAVTFAIILGANIIRGRYLLIVMPVFSLLAGQLLAGLGADDRPVRGVRWGLWILAACAVLVGMVCAAHFMLWTTVGLKTNWLQPVIAAALGCAGVAMVLFIRKRLLRAAALCAAGVMLLALAAFSAFLLRPEPTEAATRLAREVIASEPGDVHTVTVGFTKGVRAAVLLATGRRVDEWTDAGDIAGQTALLQDLLSRPGDKRILLRAEDYDALPSFLRQQLTIVASRSFHPHLVENAVRRTSTDRTALLESSTSTLHLLRPTPPRR